MAERNILDLVYLIAALVLVVPAVLATHKNWRRTGRNLAIWAAILAVILIAYGFFGIRAG